MKETGSDPGKDVARVPRNLDSALCLRCLAGGGDAINSDNNSMGHK